MWKNTDRAGKTTGMQLQPALYHQFQQRWKNFFFFNYARTKEAILFGNMSSAEVDIVKSCCAHISEPNTFLKNKLGKRLIIRMPCTKTKLWIKHGKPQQIVSSLKNPSFCMCTALQSYWSFALHIVFYQTRKFEKFDIVSAFCEATWRQNTWCWSITYRPTFLFTFQDVWKLLVGTSTMQIYFLLQFCKQIFQKLVIFRISTKQILFMKPSQVHQSSLITVSFNRLLFSACHSNHHVHNHT